MKPDRSCVNKTGHLDLLTTLFALVGAARADVHNTLHIHMEAPPLPRERGCPAPPSFESRPALGGTSQPAVGDDGPDSPRRRPCFALIPAVVSWRRVTGRLGPLANRGKPRHPHVLIRLWRSQFA